MAEGSSGIPICSCALKDISHALTPISPIPPPDRLCVHDSPVHRELGNQRHVVLHGHVLILQEVEVHTVHRDPLPPEVVALVVFVKVLQRCLQLEEPRTE